MTETTSPDTIAEVKGNVGFITLNRPKALNALSLGMVRDLMSTLLKWKDDDRVKAVAIRGMGKEGPFGNFCAGGDIRFLHTTAIAGDPTLEDFFNEEYTLNHFTHTYPKPYIAFLDGIVMGGGMGITQGASFRVVTERTKMAMPETAIGLFPDVGGGYFLAQCPGFIGEYLGLTGDTINAQQAVQAKLADIAIPSASLEKIWETLPALTAFDTDSLKSWMLQVSGAESSQVDPATASSHPANAYFDKPSVKEIVDSIERDAALPDASDWLKATALTLRKRSPLMLHIVLQQIRSAKGVFGEDEGKPMTVAQDLWMERIMVRNCFHVRPGKAAETVEGIRALVIDKDQSPKWNPPRIEDVTPEMVAEYFVNPWPDHAHPLRHLAP